MQHKLLLIFWATSLVALFTLAADSNAQETLQPYAPPIVHSFLDSANVYPESVTVDQSSGTLLLNGRGILKFQSCYFGKYIELGPLTFAR